MVNCGLCNETKDLLTKAHLQIKHNGMTKEEYLAIHPEHDEARFWGDAAHVRIPGNLGKPLPNGKRKRGGAKA